MSERTTGEWTVESVRLLAVVNTKGAERIADAHNAQIVETNKQLREKLHTLVDALKRAEYDLRNDVTPSFVADNLKDSLANAKEWK